MNDVRLAQSGGYIFIVHTAMTPTQVEIVQDSFRLLSGQSNEASRVFYDELFRLSPELRGLFPDDMTPHKAKFVQMLSTIVRSLDRIAAVSEHVADLGRRHMGYDVEDEHYAIVAEAFSSMLSRVLGPDLKPEISESWAAAYDMLAHVMQKASAVPAAAEAFFGSIIRSVLASQYGVGVGFDRTVAGRSQITHGIERSQIARLS
ncbi:MAG: globin domain-containing protein [Rhodomicrobiaceae bacterium]